MMNNEKEKDAIDASKLDEILPKYEPLKLNGINLAQNYVSAFNTGMNIYQCVNQLQGYIEWVVKAVNDVVKLWNIQVGESIDQSKAIVRETTTEQFNTEWTNKQPELIEQVNTLTTNQFNKDWGVLENRINTTLETQNTNIQNIQSEQNELVTNTNNNINDQNTKINSIQTQQNNLSSNQTNLANQQTTLSNRMDTFTSLSEGSTTGDAELQDIRAGANGITYNNAGDAVRGQYSQLKEDLVNSKILKKIKIEKLNGSVTKDGALITEDTRLKHNSPIKLIRGQSLVCTCTLYSTFAVIAKYNGEGKLFTPLVSSDTDKTKTYTYTAENDIEVMCSYLDNASIYLIEPYYDVYDKINALNFGFKNDGLSDNSDIMDVYINNYSNKPIYFPSGIYLFSRTINFPDKFYLSLEKNAIFKPTNEFKDEYFFTIRKGSTRSDYTDGSYLDGGTFDCNYIVDKCLGLYKCRQSFIRNLTIKNVNKFGIVTRTEDIPDGTINLENIVIHNEIGKYNTIGIYDNGFDTHGRNIEILNFQTAIETISGRWYDISAWFSVGNLLAESIFSILDGYDIIFDGVTIDTYRYGFKTSYTNYGGCISNVLWIRNEGIYTDDLVNQYPLSLLLNGGENPLYLITNVSCKLSNGFSIKVGGEMPNTKIKNVRIGSNTYDSI